MVTDFYYKNGKLIGVNGGMSSHNIIANISKLGLDIAVYGACGNDKIGDIAIKSLSDLGVDISEIKKIDGKHTRCFHVSYLEKDTHIVTEINDILKESNKEDILIFDNLNEKNPTIINNCNK